MEQISFKLTKDQAKWLDEAAQTIKERTGDTVSRKTLVFQLMEKGFPVLHKEIQDLPVAQAPKGLRLVDSSQQKTT